MVGKLCLSVGVIDTDKNDPTVTINRESAEPGTIENNRKAAITELKVLEFLGSKRCWSK